MQVLAPLAEFRFLIVCLAHCSLSVVPTTPCQTVSTPENGRIVSRFQEPYPVNATIGIECDRCYKPSSQEVASQCKASNGSSVWMPDLQGTTCIGNILSWNSFQLFFSIWRKFWHFGAAGFVFMTSALFLASTGQHNSPMPSCGADAFVLNTCTKVWKWLYCTWLLSLCLVWHPDWITHHLTLCGYVCCRHLLQRACVRHFLSNHLWLSVSNG